MKIIYFAWIKDITNFHQEILDSNEIKNLDDFKEFSPERKPYSLNYKDKFIHFPRKLFGHFYHSVYCCSNKQSK